MYITIRKINGISGKETACQCRKCKRHGFCPWSGRSSGEGNGNLLQYLFLENSMDRGAWQASFHRVSKSCTNWSNLACTHASFDMSSTVCVCVCVPWRRKWLCVCVCVCVCVYSLETEMATHSSIFAWRILWTEEPGGLDRKRERERWFDYRPLCPV